MNPAEMLALVAIGYRGCELNLSLPLSRKRVADEITRCLDSFGPAQCSGGWSLIWGPAGYRPGIAGLDTSAMYVAGSKKSPSTIAIVIRGTNLFSLQDWTSNLLIEPHVWSYGFPRADVKVSLSVWLGLKILQTLKSDPLAPLTPESALERMQADIALHQARFEYAILKQILSEAMPYDAVGLLAGIIGQLPHLTSKPANFTNEVALLEEVKDAQSNAPRANTLLEFLKDFVSKAAEPVDVHIVGHSKGGALAAAFALWLADTQGDQTGSGGWDSGNLARLHIYSFAAPTPGNGGFANHFQQKLNDAYRLANPYDIVPHAWDPNAISQIPDLYDTQLHELKVPANALAALSRPLDYQHEVAAQEWCREVLTPRALPSQIAFNHLDAYLLRLGIFDPQTLSFLALFAPIEREPDY